ncbi:MAG: PCYCGC motif-containing (lipo)protein [Betaproteobacteria bacterium]
MTRKAPTAQPPAQPPAGRGYTSLVAGALIVAALAAIYYSRRSPAAQDDPQQSAAAQPAGAPSARQPEPASAEPPAWAKFGPHEQKALPPLDFPGYETPRPHDVIEAAYRFAAEHPEVLSYVPCFCGCEHSGHRGNEDCFVRERALDGDVITWEPHGMECTVCIDVATRAMQMYKSGATVRQIHDAVAADFGPRYPSMTPTPTPPQ